MNSNSINSDNKLIGLDKFRIYMKYDGDYGELDDFRYGSKKDRAAITIDEWRILSSLTECFSDLRTQMYSTEMEAKMFQMIESLRPRVTTEVFEMIENNKKPEPNRSKSWIKRLLKL